MKTSKLSELGELKNGLNFGNIPVENPVKIIGVANFQTNSIPDYSSLKSIDASLVDDDSLLRENDIIFVRSNGNKDLVGRMMIIKGIKEKVSYSGFCIRFRPNKNINPDYLFYALKSSYCKQQYSHSQQTNITNLSQEILKNVNVPRLDEKQENLIGSFLSEFDKKVVLNKSDISRLYELGNKFFDFYYKEQFIKEHTKKVQDFASINVGRQYANFAEKGGKYRYFTCSKDILFCNQYEFDGKNIIISTHGDFKAEHYDGKFNAYFCNSIIKPFDDSFYGLLYFSIIKQLPILQQKSSGSVIKFIGNDDIMNLSVPEVSNLAEREVLNKILEAIQKLSEDSMMLKTSLESLLPTFVNGQAKII